MSKIHTIFLDMDGVIADWNHAFCNIYGANYDDVIANWPAGESDLHKVLGIEKAKQWAVIGANPNFWIDLPVFPYAHEMVSYLKSRYHVRICTSPSSDPQSVADKLRWLSKHKFKFGKDYHINPDKKWLAAPGRLLIDDMSKNIDPFIANGGEGFLFPQVWNSSGAYSGDVVQLIKDLF